jgi:hypothetical protein
MLGSKRARSDLGTVRPPFGIPPRPTVRPRLRRRPLAITLIALFQFARAGFILFVAVSTWLAPDAHLSSRLEIRVLTYVAARHNLPSPALIPVVLPIIAALPFALGCGLWFLKKWARNTLMITSGTTALLWIRYFAFDWALGDSILKTELQRQIVYSVISLDAMVFCCLAFLPDVSEAFGQKE